MDVPARSGSPTDDALDGVAEPNEGPQTVKGRDDGDELRTTSGTEFRKLDVSIRDNEYIAGQKNITAIVIRNTYSESIRLISVTARHSSLNSHEEDQVFRGNINKKIQPSRTNIRLRFYSWNPFSFFKGGNDYQHRRPVFELNHNSYNSDRTEILEPIVVNAQNKSKITLDQYVGSNREVIVNAQEGAAVSITDSTTSRGRPRDLLVSPSSEVVSEYGWKTSHSILFIPSRIGIDIEIRYSVHGEERSQVVSSIFDIKPPMISIILGGICGGLIGNLARSFTETDVPTLDARFFVKLVGSCLLSVMAVITLSRKSGSQAFITVEDFFGAFVLGSLIGYQGTAFFEKTVTEARTTSPPPAP